MEQNNWMISNEQFDIYYNKKVLGGYIFKKFIRGSLLDLIEQRDININLSEEDARRTAQKMLLEYNPAQ